MTTDDGTPYLQDPGGRATDDTLAAAAAAMPAIPDGRDSDDDIGEDQIPLDQRTRFDGAAELEVDDDGTDPLAHLAETAEG